MAGLDGVHAGIVNRSLVDGIIDGMDELLTGQALTTRAEQALAVPLTSSLGAHLLDPDDPSAGAVFCVGDIAGNGAGGIHAAALSAAVELAAYLALLPHLRAIEHAITHSVAVHFITAAAVGDLVEVQGVIDRRTRRLAFASATATVRDQIVARAQLTKSIVPFP